MDANRLTPDVEATGTGTVAAVFNDRSVAERAVSELTNAGFDRDNIGIAVSQSEGSHVDEGWMSRIRDMFSGEDREEYSSTDAPETLRNMGIGSDRTSHFHQALQEGNVLLTVRVGSRQQEAIDILQRNGGSLGMNKGGATDKSGSLTQDIESRGELAGRDLGELPPQRLQLFGEILRVHKERVQRGEVRLYKEVVSEQKNIDVPVMREEVVIERVAADRSQPTSAADFGNNQEIRVPLTEERVQVEKTPVVNEEVRIGKRQVQEVRNVSDTVRHEEVRVDKEGDVDINRRGDVEREGIRRDEKGKKIA